MTTATDTTNPEVAVYLEEVAARLGGLAEAERTDLLDDLAQHLAEVMAEPGPPLRERVGPPDAYAAELLASAGVADAPARALRRTGALRARAAGAARRFQASWAGRELAAVRPVLRPVWHVARAYLAVSLLAAFTLGGDYPGFPVPRLLGSPVVGFVATVAAVLLSARLTQVELGPRARWALRAAGVVLVVYAFVLVDHIGERRVQYVSGEQGFVRADPCLRDGAGRPITNLYAYDAEGRLLDPVLLYDQAGRPIDNLCPDVDSRGRRLITEYQRDANGAPVINAFPRSQSVVAGDDLHSGPWVTPPPLGGPAATVTTSTVPPPAVVVPRLAAPATSATTSTTASTTSTTSPTSTTSTTEPPAAG